MNKKTIFLGLLLITHAAQSMDIVPIQNTNQKEYDEKCDRVARYFVKHIPTRTLSDAFDTFPKLDTKVQFLIRDHAAEKELTTLMLITIPKDIFTSIIQLTMPTHEIKPKVDLGNSEYSEYRNGYPEYKPVVIIPIFGPKNNVDNSIELAPINQQKISEKNIIDAFVLFSEYAKQEKITIHDLVEDSSFSKDSMGNNFGYYFDDGDLTKSYGWSLNDFMDTTSAQRNKLKEIADGHKAGLSNRNKRYKMTQEDIDLLMPIKDIINENGLFKHLQIGIDCEPPTKFDKMKDALLLVIPLSITEGVIPHLIYNNIDGKLQGIFGTVASYGAGFIMGNSIFPIFDTYNYSNRMAKKWFGPDNKTTVEKRWSFAILGLLHYITHAIAQQLLNLHNIPCQIAGYTLHGLRVLSYAAGSIDMTSYFKHPSWAHAFTSTYHLKKYDHPLKRRNKDDKSYTLIDLLNAQPDQTT